MSINIYLQNRFLDFSYGSTVSMERRFFVTIEINSTNKEVLNFFSEMNSAFEKHGCLDNKVILEYANLVKEFKEQENSKSTSQPNKELISLDKKEIYSSLGKVIVDSLESLPEQFWLDYCEKRYIVHNKEFNQEEKNRELNKFRKSNEMIKELWSNFPHSFKQFSEGGDYETMKKIPGKFADFWTEAHYFHLKNKLSNKDNHEKKPKI